MKRASGRVAAACLWLLRQLLADPRQVQTRATIYRIGGKPLADVGLGHTWPLARWRPSDGESAWVFQANLEGMGYSRFLLSGGINEFQTIDFFANLPLEARWGPFSTQAMLFHESSHLGDDYIRRTGDIGFRYSVEGVRARVSWEPVFHVRLYAGGMRLVHSIPDDQRGEVQGGLELRSADLRWQGMDECWFYAAEDVKSYGRVHWNVNSQTELGFRLGLPKVVRALRVHAGYFTGHSEYGQFFHRKEHFFDFGLSFDF